MFSVPTVWNLNRFWKCDCIYLGTKSTFWSRWYYVWTIWNPFLAVLSCNLNWESHNQDSYTGAFNCIFHSDCSALYCFEIEGCQLVIICFLNNMEPAFLCRVHSSSSYATTNCWNWWRMSWFGFSFTFQVYHSFCQTWSENCIRSGKRTCLLKFWMFHTWRYYIMLVSWVECTD